MEWLNLFKDFFGFNVPLAICILVAIGIYNLFSKLQEERRKDYDITFKSQARLIKELNKTISDRNQRISDLEKLLDNKKEVE